MATIAGEIKLTVLAQLGDNEPHEVATAVVPIDLTAGRDGAGVSIRVGEATDRVRRALTVFGEALTVPSD